MIEKLFTPELIDAFGWTLLHSIWQGAIFAILLVLVLIVFRSFTSQSRYVVSVGLFCAFFLSVSTTFWMQWQTANDSAGLISPQIEHLSADDTFVVGEESDSQIYSGKENKLVRGQEISSLSSVGWMATFKDYFDRHLPLLVTFWFLGILFLQLRFLGQLAYVQRLKHYGTQMFPLSWSEKIEELLNDWFKKESKSS